MLSRDEIALELLKSMVASGTQQHRIDAGLYSALLENVYELADAFIKRMEQENQDGGYIR